ncbi:organic cation transporter-like protein isoform X2 [Condylostylus longicornis]|nr:organic cation transporter-like protein isoform X2 [Condylostylus longicornis]XP_055374342.1 organic cation transporter-like protein isoform X2 [Condylostylus longicornis]
MNTELNWVCDSAYISIYGQSFFFVGSVIGTLLYGFLSDKFGRLVLLIIANLSAVTGDIATTFSTDIITFSISRFVSGLAVDTNAYLMYMLVLEYIRPSKRIVTLNFVIGIFYTAGLVITPWIAVAIGHWKFYLLSITSPLCLVFTFIYIVNESAQWLVTQNNIDGAILRLKRIAKFNGVSVSEDDFLDFRRYCEIYSKNAEGNENPANFTDLFKKPRLRKRIFILFYVLMVTTLCYNIVSRNVEGTGLSPFMLFSVSSTTVFPAAAVLIFLQNKIGRKGMATSSAIFCAVIAGITGVVLRTEQGQEKNVALLASLQILARFGIALAYESGNQFAMELMPTSVRGQAIAGLHVAGYAISFLSVPILHLSTYFASLPSIVLTSLFLSEAFVILFLPETLNKVLPKTIEDGENFSIQEKVFDFACFKREKVKDMIS